MNQLPLHGTVLDFRKASLCSEKDCFIKEKMVVADQVIKRQLRSEMGIFFLHVAYHVDLLCKDRTVQICQKRHLAFTVSTMKRFSFHLYVIKDKFMSCKVLCNTGRTPKLRMEANITFLVIAKIR